MGLNLMMQKLEPCKGEVRCSKGIRVRQYHQHFDELLPLEKTGIEYLRDEFDLQAEKPRQYLGQFGLPGASHATKIGNLSGGQKARVAFAALMLMNPHIIVLDEPTNHLDIESVEALTEAIRKFNGGLVLVSHDARLITKVECEIWVVEKGTCYRFEKGFDAYREYVLSELAKRQEEVERMEEERRKKRAAQRARIVGEERLKAAKKKAEEEAKAAEEKAKKDLAKAEKEHAAKAAKKKKQESSSESGSDSSDSEDKKAKKSKAKKSKKKADSSSDESSSSSESEDEKAKK